MAGLIVGGFLISFGLGMADCFTAFILPCILTGIVMYLVPTRSIP